MTPGQRSLLAIVLIPAFVSLLAVSSINVVLPAIGSGLGTGSGGLQLLVSGYALVFGVLLVPAGRAGDVLGRGRLFIIGLLVFGVGSLASGLAPDIITLNLARLLTGIGAGLFNPQVTGMIQQYFAGELRGRAFGLLGGIIGISVALGPILAGVLIGWLGPQWGWRSSFLINVPFALAGAWAAWRALPASAWSRAGRGGSAGTGPTAVDAAGGGRRGSAAPRSAQGPSRRARPDLDPVGMLLLTMGTVLIMVPFTAAGHGGWIWSILVVGLLVILAWVAWERRYAGRGRSPMVDLELFRIPSFAFGSLAISIYFMGYTAVWLIIVQYVQSGLGLSALASGLISVPAALASGASSAAAGRRATPRAGRAMVMWGMALAIMGMAASIGAVRLQAGAGWSPWWMAVTLGILGIGQGLVVTPNQTLSLADVPVEHAGAAGGVMQTGQRIGTSIGIAMITGLAFAVAERWGWGAATQVGLAVEILIIALAAAVAAADLRIAKRAQRRA
ncbi:MFS transporter [Actinomyces bowdenii]|uniref:MFS transporter n=2 Tax=Actinomyces bowdenii TaxID=131109 RepID=A0A3P1V6K6_9ACTO|nr:MFS transporter [Actinomyces bowdenii]RRD29779.1 MFS transporter [Actinomyces bowdenii]